MKLIYLPPRSKKIRIKKKNKELNRVNGKYEINEESLGSSLSSFVLRSEDFCSDGSCAELLDVRVLSFDDPSRPLFRGQA